MLKARNLDDQTYEQIVTAAEGRLPWLCPSWTDHNAHDPGITILELMAWYKEMQQYHMNQFTDALRCKLLKLVGVTRRPAAPARCAVELDAQDASRLAGAQLTTREGVPFELVEAIPAVRPYLACVQMVQGERTVEVGELLRDRRITFQPFGGEGEERATLRIGFSQLGEGPLRLWLDVVPPDGVPRNPFASPEQAPRVIAWQCEGAEDTQVLSDETHALSVSGYVTIAHRGMWPKGEKGLYWLNLSLVDPGCEELVRLSDVWARRWPALQQETWARSHFFCASPQADWTVCLADAQALEGNLAVFVRTKERWEQTGQWQAAATTEGRVVQLDTSGAVMDGAYNVLIISLDPVHSDRLLFDAKGLPGETFFLDLEGRTALSESFTLLCDTLDRDGQVRPALWRCVEDFYACGPRDRVFTYDPVRETITFGDGEHGALLRRGKGAVLVAQLALTYGSGGNIPGGRILSFVEDGQMVCSQAAVGGADRETAAQAQERLLELLSTTSKCVSAADYERLARATPGLRVAAAKALPAYDPDEPTGVSRMPTVTVVVAPDGAGEHPLPDERFLDAVQRQLDRVRPIGIQVKAAPPVYVDVNLSVVLRGGEENLEAELEKRVRTYLEQNGIGAPLRAGDIAALVQSAPGVLQVREVDLRVPSPGCYQNAEGDVRLPRRAIPRLKALRVEKLPVERLGR
ncbi:MAG TPA: baseplate J/gp47 family protein [Candidatus Flavonifractor merdigallinarum]|uniref:Baseplate J/gp47 family protein n=1 Tax=Candidatus Flavonifractor merdigallinarum TaxID=2838589 RepID=A0A9D1Y9E4_9FIRM|nr:baseplate J/gp47 family protein [Candidatus Flavonifractor merdigallinarum]